MRDHTTERGRREDVFVPAAASPAASALPNHCNAAPKHFTGGLDAGGKLPSSNPRNAADFAAFAGRRPCAAAQQPRASPLAAETVFGRWKPSDRLLRLSPDQHCLAQSPIWQGDGTSALVLAPTTELAQQIEVKAFSRSVEMFRTAIVVGGTNIAEQEN